MKQSVFVFGDFRLDPGKKMLYRGDAEIALSPKIVETLIVLVENQGEIVSKSDLMERVWPDTIVEDSNLSQHLHYLRKILGNAENGTPVIETLRRRGYRFNLQATVIRADTAPPPRLGISTAVPTPSVRRHGNVLTVADWEPATEPIATPGTVAQVTDTVAPWPVIAYTAAAIIALGVLAGGILLLADRRAADASPANDIQTSFLTNGHPVEGLSISPDGNYFVYHETEGPIAHLWLQQTGQSNRLEILPEAERSMGPKTFSPDGQFVYFVSIEKGETVNSLYRVPTLGGLLTKILEDVATPVTFSPDGTEMAFVRFAKENASASLVVASSDGERERVVLRPEDARSTLGVGSTWSPDGQRIAFASVDLDDAGLVYVTISAVDVSTGEVAAISPEKWDTCYRMQWSANGRGLAFVGTRHGESVSSRRDQVYFLSYPDGRSRKLTNEGNRHDPISLGLTASDEILALPMGRSSQIWAMDASGDSRTAVQITKGLLDGRAGIAPLPDGRVGYVTRTGENVNVWIMNADGSHQRQLTSEPSYVEELRASPDGTFFVFSGVKDRRSHLFRIEPDGSGQTQLTAGNGSEVDSSISPDGKSVVYAASVFEGIHGKTFLWKVPSGNAPAEKVSRNECWAPHFSPDGKMISCVFGEDRIAILRAEDGEVVGTFKVLPQTRLNFGAPWTRDGGSLCYISLEGGAANIWLQSVEGGKPRRLTDFLGGDIYNFAFSTDGTRIFLARGHPVHDAMLIRNAT